ncbi:ATP-binding cassette domain-containing protein [Planococcus sp. 107-1]|nr:ATP-binding cassette domain-containing protein [Planococcus sp. 107-1]UJF26681.1 ATP-binding cassette domain-containing protein [Planococcus sp. 107-1]
METMLAVEGLGKSFKDKQIISNISFEVKKGEIMALLGPNGAGKSTTIRNIMGIMYPDGGRSHSTTAKTKKSAQQNRIPTGRARPV